MDLPLHYCNLDNSMNIDSNQRKAHCISSNKIIFVLFVLFWYDTIKINNIFITIMKGSEKYGIPLNGKSRSDVE